MVTVGLAEAAAAPGDLAAVMAFQELVATRIAWGLDRVE